LAAKFVGIRHRAAALFLQKPKLCTDLERTLVYILHESDAGVVRVSSGVRAWYASCHIERSPASHTN